ncbi:LOW QUALITY PROTEIN: enhancer of mRNA-decapping protein 4-like [Paramacrobiotus metropolitanus]|uniref:LOW QUALITY PROTEIN: enhancer of mRNA-decapping protein 4-like n=1 Tax=Paramacrobiotus metropolitanus TaxID=2943436 RepID=UPI002445794E|nr:LOW QUALITY PROTEIN: enhancer of mRNA-decapping protein 4-like [Paramacrobiotus metropolitanus]
MSAEGIKRQELVDTVEEALSEQQEIALNENDDDANSHAVRARRVTILYSDRDASEQARHHSHYVRTKPCIEYKWEKKYYAGHLVAVHMSGKIFAYCVQTHHSGKVRVTNEESGDNRCLLKEFDTQLVDIDFAHIPDAIYIACMEQNGWCSVFSVTDAKPMTYELMIKISLESAEPILPDIPCRAVWCVHIPEKNAPKTSFEDVNEPANRLILTCNGKAVVASVPIVQKAAGAEKKIVIGSEAVRGVTMTPNGAKIWDIKMSPDGVIVCAAREDGNVHFYQCVLDKSDAPSQDPANLVYTWIPHDGLPVHTIHFFDDFSPGTKQDQFWMYALSGCEYGRQFRIWNCQHWYCLQTIDVAPSPLRPTSLPKLHVTVDPKGKYMVLGDAERNLLMYLRVDQDPVRHMACVTSLMEFLVGSPILSLAVVEVNPVRPSERSVPQPLEPEENGFESRLLTIHSNLLQQMSIAFVGEQLPSRMPSNGAFYHEESAPLQPRKEVKEGSPAENGDAKTKKKRSKKARDAFSLDDVPTPVMPAENIATANGGEKNLTFQNSATHRRSISPAFVLQPPSAFDAIPSVRRESSQANTPTFVKEVAVEDESHLLKERNDFYLPRDNSVATNISTVFGVPPVELGASPPSSDIADNFRAIPVEYGGRNSQSFDPDLRSRSGRLLMDERVSKLETSYSDLLKLCASQHQMLERQTTLLEQLIASAGASSSNQAIGAGDASVDAVLAALTASVREGFVNLVETMRPLQKFDTRMNTMANDLGKIVENSVGKEVKNQLAQQNLQKAMKPINEKFVTEMTTKLVTFEAGIRQKFEDVFRGQQFGALMAQALAPQFHDAARLAVQEAIKTQLAPAVQDVMNASLNIMSTTFASGTKEYLAQHNKSLENHFTRIDAALEERIRGLEQVAERACTAAVQTVSVDLLKEMQMIVDHSTEQLTEQIVESLGTQISQNVTSSVKSELREQQSVLHESMVQAIRSGIATPGGQVATQHHKSQQALQDVKQALTRQDYNSAFRIALSASNLDVVLYVCEKVPVKEVFGKPNNLQMPVLFSLIQQLAVDIASKTDLKLQYLEEALLAIQFDDLEPSSSKFLRTVLSDVMKGLTKFMQSNPSHPLSRNLKLLSNLASLQLTNITNQQASRGTD